MEDRLETRNPVVELLSATATTKCGHEWISAWVARARGDTETVPTFVSFLLSLRSVATLAAS
jgi:hypothetical protein